MKAQRAAVTGSTDNSSSCISFRGFLEAKTQVPRPVPPKQPGAGAMADHVTSIACDDWERCGLRAALHHTVRPSSISRPTGFARSIVTRPDGADQCDLPASACVLCQEPRRRLGMAGTFS